MLVIISRTPDTKMLVIISRTPDTKMLVIISHTPEDGSINTFQKVVVYKSVRICNELLSRHRAGPYNIYTTLHRNL
jgi:hypothetical protein